MRDHSIRRQTLTLTLLGAALLASPAIAQRRGGGGMPQAEGLSFRFMGPAVGNRISAAAGITGVARTTGAAISPLFAGLLFARPSLISVPFFLAGALKILYDLLLYSAFVQLPSPEETRLRTTK